MTMAKMLAQRDFDLSHIGERFELDEVMPKFEQEERTNEKTGEVILDGQFRKKATQVTVLGAELIITNETIMKSESVKCRFENLEVSMAVNPMYYKAEKIILEKEGK